MPQPTKPSPKPKHNYVREVEKDWSEDFTAELEDMEIGLAIDEHAIEEGSVRQPDLFYRVSKMLALYISRRDAAKQQVQFEEAQTDAAIRRAASLAEEKITDSAVKAQVASDPEVRAATTEHLQLAGAVQQLSALKESFQQRSYMLTNLKDLYLGNYYGAIAADSAGRGSKERAAEEAKHSMARQRKEMARRPNERE